MRLAIALFLLLAGSFPASLSLNAQSLTLTPQQSAAIDAVFAEEEITATSPGCGVALIRDGAIVDFRGYGLADVENGVAWTPQTGFHTGSMYKQFFAAAIVMLAQQGKLSLDDDVRKYIPELPDYGARITVRNLLTHTHGLRERFPLEDLSPPPQGGQNDGSFLRLLVRQKAPTEPPGARLRYGNTGPFLAGLIIDRVSGLPRAEFIARNILEPLGMTRTALGQDSRVLPPRAPAYVRDADGSLKPRPGGSIRTTLEDLARWDGQFEGANDQWQSVVRTLITPAKLRDETPVDMGMGLRLRPYRGLRRVWSPGGATGFRAMFMRFPDAKLTIALGCNRDDVEPVRMTEAIADIVLADEIRRSNHESPRPVRISRTHARRLAGTYVSDGFTVRVVERAGRLFMISDQGEFAMSPAGSDRFLFANRPVVLRDAAVDAQFSVGNGGERRLELRTVWDPSNFIKVRPIDPRTIRAEEYLGTFRSDELGSELAVVRSDSGLLLKAPRGQYSLKPLSADLFAASPVDQRQTLELFAAGPLILRFRRSGRAVDSVSVSRANLTGITFSRTRESEARRERE